MKIDESKSSPIVYSKNVVQNFEGNNNIFKLLMKNKN